MLLSVEKISRQHYRIRKLWKTPIMTKQKQLVKLSDLLIKGSTDMNSYRRVNYSDDRNCVPGQTVNTNIWYNAYKVFLVFWIMFGLGYLFMMLSFISRAMRSKTLEHLFLERLKHTHSKIWHQFTKDVVYIRRILNESYLLKFKVCMCKLHYPKIYRLTDAHASYGNNDELGH